MCDPSPILILIILAGLGLFAFPAMILNATVASGKKWGFAMGLIPALVGGLFLLYFQTQRDVFILFPIMATIPLGFGLLSLILWGRGLRDK